MRLLVAGEDRVDAGKTTVSTGLLAFLARGEAAPLGFKPRAGNDYWFDHDDVRAVLDDGRLYGKDARRLAAASAGEVRPEAINPVHRLWRPTPGRSGLLNEPDRTFLVDRVTTADGPRYVVNAEADLPADVADALPLADAIEVSTVPAFNEVMREDYLPAFERLADRVRDTETAVVESYSDIALPLDDVTFDAVATVAPGRLRVWDGDRYLKACEVARGSAREGQLEERVGNVVDMLDPVATVDLPALTSAERDDPDRVADAYAEALAAVVDAA